MTITQEITRRETITKEISLPYYSKKDQDTFFRINEDESILRVFSHDDYATITFSKKNEYFPAGYFRDAIESEPCTREEMKQAVLKAIEFIEQGIEELKTKKKSVVDIAESLYRTY